MIGAEPIFCMGDLEATSMYIATVVIQLAVGISKG